MPQTRVRTTDVNFNWNSLYVPFIYVASYKVGFGKQWSVGQIWPTTCFFLIKFYSYSCIYCLCATMADLSSHVRTVWSTKLNIFIILKIFKECLLTPTLKYASLLII